MSLGMRCLWECPVSLGDIHSLLGGQLCSFAGVKLSLPDQIMSMGLTILSQVLSPNPKGAHTTQTVLVLPVSR